MEEIPQILQSVDYMEKLSLQCTNIVIVVIKVNIINNVVKENQPKTKILYFMSFMYIFEKNIILRLLTEPE